MSPRRVVITGLGVVAPNAHGTDDFKTALYEGRSGIRHIEKLKELGFGCQVGGVPQNIDSIRLNYFTTDELLAMNSAMTFSCMAAIDAWRDAGLTVPKWDDDVLYEDTGAIVGTGIGGVDTLAEKLIPQTNAGQVRRLGSAMVEQVMASSVSAKLSGLFALGNQVTTNSCACSTGTEAIIMGAQRIRDGLANRMLVGGAESSSLYSWAGFDAMRVLNRNSNDAPESASRPMSATAKGFIPGCGAGILVIEDLESATARGARIYAEIIGSSVNSGGQRRGGSMTSPSGYSVQRCIREAVLAAKIKPSEIDYINGHLTATGADPQEIGSWQAALELDPKEFPNINSTKSLIGHSLGAAGAIECVATVLQMHHGFVHGSINCEDLHERVLPVAASVVHKSFNKVMRFAVKASFGFGDVNSCIVFSHWR